MLHIHITVPLPFMGNGFSLGINPNATKIQFLYPPPKADESAYGGIMWFAQEL